MSAIALFFSGWVCHGFDLDFEYKVIVFLGSCPNHLPKQLGKGFYNGSYRLGEADWLGES